MYVCTYVCTTVNINISRLRHCNIAPFHQLCYCHNDDTVDNKFTYVCVCLWLWYARMKYGCYGVHECSSAILLFLGDLRYIFWSENHQHQNERLVGAINNSAYIHTHIAMLQWLSKIQQWLIPFCTSSRSCKATSLPRVSGSSTSSCSISLRIRIQKMMSVS